MESETVTLPKDEFFRMLDIAHEMIGHCAVSMPADRYYGTCNAVWVLAYRAAGKDREADETKEKLLRDRETWLASERAKQAKREADGMAWAAERAAHLKAEA